MSLAAVLPGLWAILVGGAAWRFRPATEAERSVAAARTRVRRPDGVDPVTRLGRTVRSVLRRPAQAAAERRTGLATIGALLALAGVAAFGPGGIVLGAVVPLVSHAVSRRRRGDHLAASLDGALAATELLALALRGGGTVRTALADVAPWLSGPAASLVDDLLTRSRRGWLLVDELARASTAAPPPLRSLLVVLLSAERDGAPVVTNLERLAAELRAEQRRSLEAAARRVPVRLLFPLVVGVLPAVVLLAVVPVVVATLGSVRGGT